MIKTKICNKCGKAREISEFNKDTRTRDGLQRRCPPCDEAYNRANKLKIIAKGKGYWAYQAGVDRGKQNAINAKRRANKRLATPQWFEKEAVRDVYIAAKLLSMHVDHQIPLTNPQVCGLHCLSNLQWLTGAANLSKGNRSWPDQWAKKKDPNGSF